jgi:hypothetical protein
MYILIYVYMYNYMYKCLIFFFPARLSTPWEQGTAPYIMFW